MDKFKKRKGFDYFEYFSKCSKIALEAAEFLQTVFSGFGRGQLSTKVDAMHKIENDADMLKHDMLTALAREFMTPIESEDIVALSQELDDVVDALDDVVQCLYIFNVEQVRGEALTFAALIVKCCKALTGVMGEFKSFKKSKTIHQLCVEVNNIESDGDKLFAASIRKLYVGDCEMRELMVWTKILEGLENCLDACEDCVDIIEGVIMKNS